MLVLLSLIFNLQINYPIRIKDIPFKSFQLKQYLIAYFLKILQIFFAMIFLLKKYSP